MYSKNWSRWILKETFSSLYKPDFVENHLFDPFQSFSRLFSGLHYFANCEGVPSMIKLNMGISSGWDMLGPWWNRQDLSPTDLSNPGRSYSFVNAWSCEDLDGQGMDKVKHYSSIQLDAAQSAQQAPQKPPSNSNRIAAPGLFSHGTLHCRFPGRMHGQEKFDCHQHPRSWA